MPERISALRKLNLVFRFSYSLTFLFASVCGVLFAHIHADVPVHITILIPLTVLFMGIFVNFSNDYYDSLSGVDSLRFRRSDEGMLDGIIDSRILKKIYWDGNPVNNGLVTHKQARTIMAALVFICIVLSLPILIYGGWTAVLFGSFGLLIAFFYTAPPVNLGARGLGEIAVGMSFFLIVYASYTVASGDSWNNEMFVFAVTVGTMVGTMRMVDSMSGQAAHIAAGEKSISVLLGLDRMVPVIKTLIIVSYVLVAVMLYFDLTYVLLFLTVPLAFAGWRILSRREEYWEVRIAPVMFLITTATEFLFMAVIVLQMYFSYSLF